jgi:1,2-phenylacetyl-CoA epoxidase PaaB subunit
MAAATSDKATTPGGVREEAKPSQRPVWLVFARRKYNEPLAQVGTVTANSGDMAVVYARSIYDEHPWIEMIVVPRSNTRTVIAS